jgi:hypothetical protein
VRGGGRTKVSSAKEKEADAANRDQLPVLTDCCFYSVFLVRHFVSVSGEC